MIPAGFEMLPRLIPDVFCDSFEEAYEEARLRRTSPPAGDAVTRIVRSPYGGFRVFTVSMELAIDLLADADPTLSRLFEPKPYR